ncbi:MAG TPA: radical SAM protein, partial [Firmicutes bacterium]|nr:radical SAM protein [Bacillota bacterium]
MREKNPFISCHLCPRECAAQRTNSSSGFCREDANMRVALADLHFWEEPLISGSHGSGAIFFSGCNLKCVFCQNWQISQDGLGSRVSVEKLAAIFLSLQDKGAHNINLVSGSHFTPCIAETVSLARRNGLVVPVIWNSNGYESVSSLRMLDGLVDVYLPDLKYFSDELAVRYSGAPSYFATASRAIAEMFRQVGAPVIKGGLIQKGLIIRHLMLPGHLNDTKKVLGWIATHLPKTVYVSLMAQYIPMHRTDNYPEINHRLSRRQYDKALAYLLDLGLENGYIQ